MISSESNRLGTDKNNSHKKFSDAHFKQNVEETNRGLPQGGGFPLELPAIPLSEPLRPDWLTVAKVRLAASA